MLSTIIQQVIKRKDITLPGINDISGYVIFLSINNFATINLIAFNVKKH